MNLGDVLITTWSDYQTAVSIVAGISMMIGFGIGFLVGYYVPGLIY